MARLDGKTHSLTGVIVATAAMCMGGGALILILQRWLRLDDNFARGAILVIELGLVIFLLFLTLFFLTLLTTGLSRLFQRPPN